VRSRLNPSASWKNDDLARGKVGFFGNKVMARTGGAGGPVARHSHGIDFRIGVAA
jgi:hypothetical protein